MVLRPASGETYVFWQENGNLYWSRGTDAAAELLLSDSGSFSACGAGKALYLVAAAGQGLLFFSGEDGLTCREKMPLASGPRPYGLVLVPAAGVLHLFYLTANGRQAILWQAEWRGAWNNPRPLALVAGGGEGSARTGVVGLTDATERVHLFYLTEDGSNRRLVHHAFAGSPAAGGKPLLLSNSEHDASLPAVLADAQGNVHAAWVEGSVAAPKVKYARWTAGAWPRGGWQEVEGFCLDLPHPAQVADIASAPYAPVIPAFLRWQGRLYLLALVGDQLAVMTSRTVAGVSLPRVNAHAAQEGALVIPLRFAPVAGMFEQEWSTTAFGYGMPPWPLDPEFILEAARGGTAPCRGEPAEETEQEAPAGEKAPAKKAEAVQAEEPPPSREPPCAPEGGVRGRTAVQERQQRLLAAQLYRELQRLEREMARAQQELQRLERWYERLEAARARLRQALEQLGPGR